VTDRFDDFDLRRPNSEDEESVEPRRWWLVAGAVLVVALVAAAGLWYFSGREHAPEQAMLLPAMTEEVEHAPESAPPAEEYRDPSLPRLEESDGYVRDLLALLSAHPELARWLATPRLVRTVTVAVDNIAEGRTPATHLRFLARKQAFRVEESGGQIIVDPRSYQRYDDIADVVASIDVERSVRTYRSLKPLFDEAYRELGHPEGDFDRAVERAIRRLLETPVTDGDVALRLHGGVAYAFADQRLESLSDAQKHILRMGPRNSRLIHGKLRELAGGLGIPADRLPRPVL
jgi:hypothetical protein